MKNITNNKEVKIANVAKIYSLVRMQGEQSKSQLAVQAGLSFVSVSNICNALVEAGLFKVIDTLESTGGRKAACIAFVPDYAYTIVIDLHHTQHGYVALVDLVGNICRSERFDIMVEDTLETVLGNIKHAYSKLLPVPAPRILGVCVGVSAVLNEKTGLVLQSSNPLFERVQVGRHIEELFPNLHVIVENDANLAGLSQVMERSVRNRLFLFFTQGIGMGITINGQLYKGADGFAGELGHIKVTGNDRQCKCGHHGCLRTVATLESIASDLGEADVLIASETSTDYAYQLARRYTEGEKAVIERVDYAAEKIGEAIAALSDLFNPQEIVLGGNQGVLFPLIRQQIWLSCRSYSKLARSVDTSVRTIDKSAHELVIIGSGERMFGHWLENSFMLVPLF
ncbi:ROK family protein [Parasphaerochaeta coccoides]|uniref:ROK family protein n=1 Tax=Parasphaerochaeta coccoides (strain ATCC BAA-1237 / DSM 17374 / SPN1) TaxID=760011 RepID=F4GIR7_PARC1|nr:ROK family protein [Parasphaerochaeta coccoides]AEC02685.1 ROK family protein [Parasphaerochaeta coccoides DSM 17374]